MSSFKSRIDTQPCSSPACRRGVFEIATVSKPDRYRGSAASRALALALSAQQPRHHKSRLGCRLNAGDVEWAERHGCRESRTPPWMADGGGPTERRRSEGTLTKEAPNREPGHLVT
jgi:hypothetical protein